MMMRAADELLTTLCYWLEEHRRITTALLCVGIVVVFAMDMPR